MSGVVDALERISTHAPRVRRDRDWMQLNREILAISTHAPRVRRDAEAHQGRRRQVYFYSRASCEARPCREAYVQKRIISTHAPRVRRDFSRLSNGLETFDFYSRASCEARLMHLYIIKLVFNFYSRASCEARQELSEVMLQV